MQEKHKSFFLWSLGLPLATDRKKLIWDPSTVFPVKRTRYFFRNIESHTEISQVDVFAQSDFKPLQTVSGQIIPVGPLLRVQRVYPGEIMHLSWIQYTPTCMLYDHSFFGGTAQFRLKCNLTTDGKIPQLPWATLLPPDWCHKWTQFLAAIRAGANSIRNPPWLKLSRLKPRRCSLVILVLVTCTLFVSVKSGCTVWPGEEHKR